MARISREKQELVRSRLLRAAAEAFARDGLQRARIDSISQVAGYAKGTVYNYFKSKEDLFGAVIEEIARKAAQRAEMAGQGQNARARIYALARADVAVARDEPAFVKVLVREAMSFHPNTYQLILARLGPYVAAVESAIASGQASGEVRTDRTAGQLAALFLGLLSLHYIQHWGSRGAWPSLEDVPDLVVSAFWDGVAARASGVESR